MEAFFLDDENRTLSSQATPREPRGRSTSSTTSNAGTTPTGGTRRSVTRARSTSSGAGGSLSSLSTQPSAAQFKRGVRLPVWAMLRQALPSYRWYSKGVFEKRRFLDLVRHFIVFEETDSGKLTKKIAGYHQFPCGECCRGGNAVQQQSLRMKEAPGTLCVRDANCECQNPVIDGLGVVWHTCRVQARA